MTFRDYWQLAKKRLYSNRWMFFFNTFLAVVALLFIGFSIMVPQVMFHGKRTVEKSLAGDIENYGVMSNSVDVYENEKVQRYFSYLAESEEIESVGMWQYTGMGGLKTENSSREYWTDILEIHNKAMKTFDSEESDYVQAVAISPQAMGINQLDLLCGELEPEYSENQILVYLGYNFREIPVGTAFSAVDGEENTTYVVAGILAKDTTILDWQTLMMGSNSFKFSYGISLDNMMLLRIRECDPGYLYLYNFFSCAEGYTYEDAAKKVKEISEELGITVETDRLSNRMESVMGVTDWLISEIERLAGLLCFSSMIILLSSQLLTLLRRKEELGVWISCGIHKRQIVIVLLLENAIKMFLSAGIAIGIFALFWKSMMFDESVYHELRYVIYYNLDISILFVALSMAVLVSVMPIGYIYKKPLSALVKGDWEKGEGKKRGVLRESPLISGLFVISFVASFLTMYYGLGLFSQNRMILEEREKAFYEEVYVYPISYAKEIQESKEIPIPSLEHGNVFIRCGLPVGDEILYIHPVDILWKQGEAFLETVKYLESYRVGETVGEPQCIIGNKYEKEAFTEGNITYIKIFGVKCRVIGVFADAAMKGMDQRCIVFADSLTKDEKEKLLFRSDGVSLIYKKAVKNAESEREAFLRWTDVVKDPDVIGLTIQDYDDSYDDGDIFEYFMPLYQKIFIGMLFLCFLNCAFLAYVWGGMHVYEYMLKRTLGFSSGMILKECIRKQLVYEAMALGVVAVVTILYEIVVGNLSGWWTTISGGFGAIVLLFILFGIVLSLFPLVWVMKMKPATVLKCQE